MDNEEKFVCAVCGEEFTADDLTKVENGDLVCPTCLEAHYIQCEDCGKYYPASEITQIYNGDEVCQDCLSENYNYCEECREYYPINDTRYIDEYGITVCDDCFNQNFRVCEHCDTIMYEEDAYFNESGEPFCSDCYNELYYHCIECGCEVHRDEVQWYDDDPYCPDCYDEIDDNGDDDNGIYSYHSFNHNNYIPRYDESDDVADNPYLYGLELEVAGRTSYASDVVDILQGNAISMYDSSVDGFELVFMPVTRKYMYNQLVPVLKEALKFMINHDFEGHNKGGIHVHFTELANSMQVANMTKILYGDEKDRKLWLKIIQRRPESMHWCSMTSSVYSTEDILEQGIYAPAGTNNHGTALNYCTRTHTHELRIFNSNLRIERILKNFECVFALQDYVSANSEPVCDTRGFMTFVDTHSEDYPHLVSFLHEKRLFEVAHKFYGDNYISKPKADDTIDQVSGMIEDLADSSTNADDLLAVAV